MPTLVARGDGARGGAAGDGDTGPVRFKGAIHFRSRLALSMFSGRVAIFEDIRPLDASEGTGLRDYEVSFLRLLDKLSDHVSVRINDTGTAIRFAPGSVVGGEFEHDCPTSRPLSYFIEGVLPLLLFAREPVRLVLRGVTNSPLDLSVDTLQSVTLPLVRRISGAEPSMRVVKRGAEPAGGGEVLLTCNTIANVSPLELVDAGLVKRVRGVAYTARMSPSFANRLVDSSRSVLNRFTPDVYIYTDHNTGTAAGQASGFGLSLVAETTTHCLLGADACSRPGDQWGRGNDADDVGCQAANLLLEEIDYGGCVDTSHQPLALMLMALAQEDLSRLRLGRLSDFSVALLRDLKTFLGVKFKVDVDAKSHSVVLACVGVGYRNVARRHH